MCILHVLMLQLRLARVKRHDISQHDSDARYYQPDTGLGKDSEGVQPWLTTFQGTIFQVSTNDDQGQRDQ